MRHAVYALLFPGVVFTLSGCATKAYVQEVVGKSQATLGEEIGAQGRRIDQQGKRLEDQAKLAEDQGRRTDEQGARIEAHGKRFEEIGGRFTKLETSIDEFGNVARSASAKADEATARAEEISNRVSRLLSSRSQRKLAETIHVHFASGRADLSDAAQTALASLIKELAENPSLAVELEGYSDSRGTPEANLALSERRVAVVRRFLVKNGIELSRVSWIGMGELTDRGSATDRAKNRRVTVRLLLPAEDLGAQRVGSTPAPRAVPPSPAPTEAKAPTE